MPIIRFCLQNHLLVNLALAFVLLIGVLAWQRTPQEIFPRIELDWVRISTTFEGASPAEVEQQITLPIEEEFEGGQDIDYISSTSSEGISNVYIKLNPDANIEDFMQEARTTLDTITELPEIAEEPQLGRLRTNFPVISVVLHGDVARAELQRLAEDVRRELLQLPDVASAAMAGDLEWEVWVVADPRDLAALDIPLQELGQALRRNLEDRPGGSIKSIEGDIRLRGRGAAPDPEEIEALVLRTGENGAQLRLGQVADVQLRFEEAKTYARFDGRPSINLTVTKSGDASTIDVADAVKEKIAELAKHIPPTVQLGTHTDLSVYIKTRLNTVKSSGLIGLVLLLFSLYLLLNFRVALIAAFGIPVSFLIGVILMHYLGYTINMISLFAFLVVLGMIVDDAIIIVENIYRRLEEGQPIEEAARQGTREMVGPILIATLTTICAFLPMFVIGGTLGLFIKVIPVVVSCCLIGSLLEAFFVLPGHGVLLLKLVRKSHSSRWHGLLERYERGLRQAVRHRYLVLASIVAVLVLTVSYAQTRLPFQLFGEVEIGQFYVNVEAPNTYSLEDTLELAKRVENVLSETTSENEVRTVLTYVGISFVDFQRWKTGSNVMQLVVDLETPVPGSFIERWISPLFSLRLSNEGRRERHEDEIIAELRERLAAVTGAQRVNILKAEAGPAGDDVELGIVGQDVELLRRKADEIRDFLQQVPGVADARHDQDPGKLEFQYSLNENGRRLGLTQEQLADAVRGGYLGLEVTHVTWDDKRIPVRIVYPEELRRDSAGVSALPIVLPSGESVYLGDVADVERGRGLNLVRRRDGRRMARLVADVDSAVITAEEVNLLLERRFAPTSPDAGYDLVFFGEKEEAREAFKDIYNALIISLCLIFFLLTVLFRSLSDPIAVILTIPLGLIGVIIGHILFGYNLQFLSAAGTLALSGIIVNDSLILVDYVRHARNEGAPVHEAVIRAGRRRARPILLTTVTTFLGLTPLIFFATGQTAFLAPMAVSLGFGLIFATALTLVALPCIYLVIEDLCALLSPRSRAAARTSET